MACQLNLFFLEMLSKRCQQNWRSVICRSFSWDRMRVMDIFQHCDFCLFFFVYSSVLCLKLKFPLLLAPFWWKANFLFEKVSIAHSVNANRGESSPVAWFNFEGLAFWETLKYVYWMNECLLEKSMNEQISKVTAMLQTVNGIRMGWEHYSELNSWNMCPSWYLRGT